MTRTISEQSAAAIADLVSARAGLSFPPSRWAIAEAAIRRAQQQSGALSAAEYLALLQSSASAFEHLVNELTVGETYFFRDPAQFDFIAKEVLPRIRRREGQIRAWSAGCATGEEPYSIAILLDQLGYADRGAVFGTDIAGPRLASARRGLYGNWSLRGSPEEVVSTYFTKAPRGYALVPRIRNAVSFSELNLAAPAFSQHRTDLQGLDLVLCRNVLIYLEREAIVRIARSLLDALNQDGWLLLGASDPPLQELVPCRVEVTAAGVAYQRQRARSPSAEPLVAPRTGSAAEAASRSGDGGSRRGFAGRVARKRREASPPPRSPRKTPAAAAPPLAPSAGWNEAAEEAACISELRTLLNQRRLVGSEAAFKAAIQRHPESAEIAYLLAVLLSQLGRHAEAARFARDALYLDRGLAVAHLALSRALERTGDRPGAERALKNAESALVVLPEDCVVSGADGERASDLLDLVRASLRLLRRGAA